MPTPEPSVIVRRRAVARADAAPASPGADAAADAPADAAAELPADAAADRPADAAPELRAVVPAVARADAAAAPLPTPPPSSSAVARADAGGRRQAAAAAADVRAEPAAEPAADAQADQDADARAVAGADPAADAQADAAADVPPVARADDAADARADEQPLQLAADARAEARAVVGAELRADARPDAAAVGAADARAGARADRAADAGAAPRPTAEPSRSRRHACAATPTVMKTAPTGTPSAPADAAAVLDRDDPERDRAQDGLEELRRDARPDRRACAVAHAVPEVDGDENHVVKVLSRRAFVGRPLAPDVRLRGAHGGRRRRPRRGRAAQRDDRLDPPRGARQGASSAWARVRDRCRSSRASRAGALRRACTRWSTSRRSCGCS